MRRGILAASVLIILFGMIWVLWPRWKRVATPWGSELRILKASFGTKHFYNEETGWRWLAAETMSDQILVRLKVSRPFDSNTNGTFVIWLTEVDARTGYKTPGFDRSEILFPNNVGSSGSHRLFSSNIIRVEFPNYPRADRELKVRIWRAGQAAVFFIPNSAPTEISKWMPQAEPQTNFVNQMGVKLSSRDDRYSIRATTREGEPPHGWLLWNLEIRDSVGNMEKLATGATFVISNFVFHPGPLKVIAHPVEYISAGFSTNLLTNGIQSLMVSDRARYLGMRDAFVFGPGNFCVSNSIAMIDPQGAIGQGESFRGDFNKDRWLVRFPAHGPNMILLFDPERRVKMFNARLRERNRNSGGALFEDRHPRELKLGFKGKTVLRHFSLRNVTSTNRIEAEIIAHHPPVEFIVAP